MRDLKTFCMFGRRPLTRIGEFSFSCEYKRHMLHLILRLTICLSESRENKQCWKLRMPTCNTPTWTSLFRMSVSLENSSPVLHYNLGFQPLTRQVTQFPPLYCLSLPAVSTDIRYLPKLTNLGKFKNFHVSYAKNPIRMNICRCFWVPANLFSIQSAQFPQLNCLIHKLFMYYSSCPHCLEVHHLVFPAAQSLGPKRYRPFLR